MRFQNLLPLTEGYVEESRFLGENDFRFLTLLKLKVVIFKFKVCSKLNNILK